MASAATRVTVSPHNDRGPWTVTIEAAATDDGTAAVIAFRFRRTADGPELYGGSVLSSGRVTPSDLQRFAWSQWATVASAALTRELKGKRYAPILVDEPLGRAMTSAMVDQPRRRPGPPPKRGPEFYSHIADRYQQLLSEGVTTPAAKLADELGHEPSTMRGFIRQARRLGFLPPATPGKAG